MIAGQETLLSVYSSTCRCIR